MFDEETLEKVTMELLSELEYEIINGYELERENYSNVILDEELESSLIRLNKGISNDEIREVIRLIKNLDNNNTILNNKQFTSYLLEGVKVPITENGATRYKTIKIIDFDNIDKNIFKAINQYTNIIVKWGRFIKGQNLHYDRILGVNLASDNQYAEKIT